VISRVRDLIIVASFAVAPAVAHAHPHEWVDVASEVLFDDKGQILAIRHHWRFDEAFSAFALQGLDTDGDGAYSQEELQPLAQVNVESLAEYSFFTFVSVGDYQAGYGAPKDYHLDLDADRLTLHYTLPLAQPLFTRGEVLLQVYDPEYYIAFALPSREAVRLVDAPAGCRLAVYPAGALDPAAAAALATIGPEQRELPDEMQDLTSGIDNSAEINCGGPTIAAGQQQAEPRSAGEAADLMAEGGADGRSDLTALPAEASPSATALVPQAAPPEVPAEPAAITSAAAPVASPGEPQAASPEAPTASAAPAADGSGLYAHFMGRVSAMQTAFNRDLTEALKGVKSDGSVFWWLGGISFLYGIVHAAGPGHGKVVISSYLLANEQRLRRGVGIAFLSALVQALVAVGIVGLMAMLLNMTSIAMTDTAKMLEVGSFALVAGLGIYLLVAKGRQAWALLRNGKAQPHNHSHDHGHGHRHNHAAACTCAHHAAPAALEKRGAAGAAAAVLSVGIRPCSGALVVLVFALAQGIFWAGIASTFLMALGTAITVAALAALAVGAKDLARRLSQGDGRRSATVMLGLEMAAAVLITALGVVLFAGSLST
jgi:nickel/cobalt exporter